MRSKALFAWPVGRWSKNHGVSSHARRQVTLGGTITSAQETSLRELREFVARLERWPDNAKVRAVSGAVLAVEFLQEVDDLLDPRSPKSGEADFG